MWCRVELKLLNFLAKPHTWFQDVLKIDTFIRYIEKRELNLRFFLTYILIAGIIPSSLDNTSRWYMLQIWSHLGHVIRPFKYQPISSSKYPKKNFETLFFNVSIPNSTKLPICCHGDWKRLVLWST